MSDGIIPQAGKFGVRISVAGRRLWLGTYDTEEEAIAVRDKHRRAKKLNSPDCDVFAERWLREYPPAKTSTLKTYESALRGFKVDFAGTPLSGPLMRSPWARGKRLTGTDYQIARAWALENRHRAVVVTTLYNAARKQGLIEDNPFADLDLPQSKGRKNIVPLTEEEVEALADSARVLREDMRPVMEGAVLTLAYTGMRVSELYALRHSDVDVARGEARISRRSYEAVMDTPKNHQARTILLPHRACEGIASVPRRLGEDLIFTTPQGKVFRAESFGRYFNQMRASFEARLSAPRREELQRYRPTQSLTAHELRHAAASWMLDKGATPAQVAQQLGHTDGGVLVSTLYGHPDADRMRESLRSLVAPRPVSRLEEVKEARG